MQRAQISAEKRTKLVAAAVELLYVQGLERTTLAHVAARADVPLGNVYYYFKTKDALAAAVIEAHLDSLHRLFASWEAERPLERLLRFVRSPSSDAENVVRFGCPFGSLCQELEKLGAETRLARAAAALLELEIAWSRKQFQALGVAKRLATDLAVDLVGSLQGMMLIAQSLASKTVLRRQTRRIEAWVSAQVEPPPSRPVTTSAPTVKANRS